MSHRAWRCFGLVACLSGMVHAQDAGVVFELPPVKVTAPLTPANPSAVKVRDPTAQHTSIDVAARRAEATDTAGLLLQAPGLAIHDAGGAGQKKTVSMRGVSASGALVLLDGVPLSGPGQAVDLSRVPAAALERIEVLRGAGRYGPGALGGVVNLVTRSPKTAGLFGSLSYGSFKTASGVVGGAATLVGGDLLALAHGLLTTGDFDYRYDELPTLAGNPLSTRTRENNHARQGGALLRFRKSWSERTTFEVLGEGLAEGRGLAGPAPNPSATARQETLRGVLALRLRHRLEGGGEVSALGSARLEHSLFSASPFIAETGGAGYAQLESSAGLEVVAIKTLFKRHKLTALASLGGEWLREPNGTNPNWARGALMLGDEVLFLDGALSVGASLRTDIAGPFVVVSPKLGASALLPHGFELKLNGGLSSRPPSFQELYVLQGTLLPNPNLTPEYGWAGDVSVGWVHERAHLQVAGFAATYEGLISYEYSPPLMAKPFNFLGAAVVGAELEAQTTPTSWLNASLSYTLLKTLNLRDDARYYLKALPYRPMHRVAARVEAGPDWLKGRVDVLYQSEQYTNRTQMLAIAPRAFINVGLTLSPLFNPRLALTAELKNLLGTSSQDVDGYPLPPRAAFLTLAAAWEAPTNDSHR